MASDTPVVTAMQSVEEYPDAALRPASMHVLLWIAIVRILTPPSDGSYSCARAGVATRPECTSTSPQEPSGQKGAGCVVDADTSDVGRRVVDPTDIEWAAEARSPLMPLATEPRRAPAATQIASSSSAEPEGLRGKREGAATRHDTAPEYATPLASRGEGFGPYETHTRRWVLGEAHLEHILAPRRFSPPPPWSWCAASSSARVATGEWLDGTMTRAWVEEMTTAVYAGEHR
jgi:hypothetical protein